MIEPIHLVGSYVRVAKDLGRHMSHFHKDTIAKVIQFQSSDWCVAQYGLRIRYENGVWDYCSWYEHWQLSAITDPSELAAAMAEEKTAPTWDEFEVED